MTLQNFLDMNLERWNQPIIEITSVATQEYNLESALDQMDSELQERKLLTKDYKDTQRYILQDGTVS